jgi:hypothetical protein
MCTFSFIFSCVFVSLGPSCIYYVKFSLFTILRPQGRLNAAYIFCCNVSNREYRVSKKHSRPLILFFLHEVLIPLMLFTYSPLLNGHIITTYTLLKK